MSYIVITEFGIDNSEFGLYLEPGFRFEFDELEPDLVANYLALGLIVNEDDEKPKPRSKRNKDEE